MQNYTITDHPSFFTPRTYNAESAWEAVKMHVKALANHAASRYILARVAESESESGEDGSLYLRVESIAQVPRFDTSHFEFFIAPLNEDGSLFEQAFDHEFESSAEEFEKYRMKVESETME